MRLLGHVLADEPVALLEEDLEEVVAGTRRGQVLAFLHHGDVADAHLVVDVRPVRDQLRGLVWVRRVRGVVEVGDHLDDRTGWQGDRLLEVVVLCQEGSQSAISIRLLVLPLGNGPTCACHGRAGACGVRRRGPRHPRGRTSSP